MEIFTQVIDFGMGASLWRCWYEKKNEDAGMWRKLQYVKKKIKVGVISIEIFNQLYNTNYLYM